MRILFTLLIVATTSPAMAQIIQPPPRSAGGLFGDGRPVDPNRTSQRLDLTTHVLVGYDDAISPEGGVSLGPSQRGFVGTASSALNYWRGRTNRSFRASGRAYVNSYSNLGIDELVGWDASLRGTTQAGSRTHLTGDVDARYHPTFFQVLESAGPPVELGSPDYSATRGVVEQRWLSGTASARVQRDWTARQHTSIDTQFGQMQPLGEVGLETQDWSSSISHEWNWRRNGGVHASYHISDQLTIDENGEHHPFESQSAQMGVVVRKRFSATRRLEVSVGAGATRGRSLSTADDQLSDFVVPAVFGTLRSDLMRTWALSFDWRRDVSVLQGLTPVPFVSDTASLGAGGTVKSKFRLSMAVAFSRGVAREGETGSYESAEATGQLQWDMSRLFALVTSYTYYSHLIRDLAAIPVGFPARYDRNTARIGLTIWLPFYGSFPTR